MAPPTKRDPQVVYADAQFAKCPACGNRSEPLNVPTSSSSTGVEAIIFCMSVMVCACCCIAGMMDSSLAFFCRNCGLRLVSEKNAHSKVKYDESGLVVVSDKTGAKVAKSPLGAPGDMNKAWVVNPQKRFTDLKPQRKFGIEKGRYNIPSSFTSLTTEFSTNYTIETRGMASPQPSDKKENQYLQSTSCSWNRHQSGPHFQVLMRSQGLSTEIAQIHLRANTIWDADIKVLNREVTSHKSWSTYKMEAEEELAWDLYGAGTLWHSSQGMLLWQMRKISSDGDGAKGRILCLLDPYDRLVALVWKTKKPGNEGGRWWEMRVYIDVSDDFLGEIIASYVAVRVQTERIRQEHVNDSS
ncbi:hypothetical protein FGLOB1_6019 [Fusarium globosum]|uniref:LITAF domain-containing protein n=1 Tax=Fusarium globosum TaxID=78864 RepID=A0A8H6D9D0_9HYPO|nr:hypothetical protein FGLOB1_6019 [Fusarium globosum]